MPWLQATSCYCSTRAPDPLIVHNKLNCGFCNDKSGLGTAVTHKEAQVKENCVAYSSLISQKDSLSVCVFFVVFLSDYLPTTERLRILANRKYYDIIIKDSSLCSSTVDLFMISQSQSVTVTVTGHQQVVIVASKKTRTLFKTYANSKVKNRTSSHRRSLHRRSIISSIIPNPNNKFLKRNRINMLINTILC